MHLLLPLLEPEGGKLLAPVEHDLRLYTRTADGKLRQHLVSSVCFSDLEVILANIARLINQWVVCSGQQQPPGSSTHHVCHLSPYACCACCCFC